MIEVSEEVKKEIESIVSYKSKFYIENIKIATNGRGLSFLKVKALGKRKLKERFVFPADLSKFVEYHQRRVRRLNQQSKIAQERRERTQDQEMETEEQKESK